MKKRVVFVALILTLLLISYSFAATGSWNPTFSSSTKEKQLTGITGQLKKYVSYAKGTVNAGATPGTFSAKFGSASTANVVPNGTPTNFTTEPTFSNSTVWIGFYRTESGSSFTGKMVWDLR